MTRILVALVLLAPVASCGPVKKRGGGSAKVTLAVLPVESDKYPKAAKAITSSMSDANIPGVDDKNVASVSLEVAQLSIECVEPTVVCYTKVGRSLDADRLLWAEIAAADHKHLKVTVTFFDVDRRKPRTARRVFANEREATQKIGELVSEATR